MKIAFVTPWYGPDIAGGVEAESRKTALNLKKSEIDVEILTTCVKDFYSNWSHNFYKPEVYEVEGLQVRRFKVKKRNTQAFDQVNLKLMNMDVNLLTGLPVSPEEEKIYMEEMINSPSLYAYIENHRKDYDFFIFMPYMFGTTFYGSRACLPEQCVLIPCLHNESYAYMTIFKELFDRAAGIIFHAPSEQRLAMRLFNLDKEQGCLMGEGIDSDFTFDAQRFRTKYHITSPFILYAGRRDITKNTPLLIDYYAQYLDRHKTDVKLLLIGSGAVDIPQRHRDNIVDLGFIPVQDKYDAYHAASFLCQPSVNESFSIVLMEAWLTETPALVHGHCDVTKEHCQLSNGGLYFTNYQELEACIHYFLSHPDETLQMGRSGKTYVLDNFTWERITKKYKHFLDNLKQKSQKPKVHIMTASMSKGDAIGNYIQTLAKILSDFGYTVKIYADGGDGKTEFIHSSLYRSTGKDILWYHYSIYAKNLKCIEDSSDYKIMDFHGVTPSKLFKGYNQILEQYTEAGERLLKKYVNLFNLCIVHSDYTFDKLKSTGYSRIVKSHLIVNKENLGVSEDVVLAKLLRQIDYLLFVGRIVPQKDVLSIVRQFAALKKMLPHIGLILVGDTTISDTYTQEINQLIKMLALEQCITMTDKIVDPHVLTTLYKFAKFTIVMSEWETFCVPIVESMYFQVPVIGINNTCIPKTIGEAGILLDGLDFQKNASIIYEYWSEKYRGLQEKCMERVRLYEEGALRKRLEEIVTAWFPGVER
jgi:glycosyltransferase involved in cell wall biosynthesis